MLQPFSTKQAQETDPDKRAMMERLLTRVNAAVDVVEKALADQDNKEDQAKAKQVGDTDVQSKAKQVGDTDGQAKAKQGGGGQMARPVLTMRGHRWPGHC